VGEGSSFGAGTGSGLPHRLGGTGFGAGAGSGPPQFLYSTGGAHDAAATELEAGSPMTDESFDGGLSILDIASDAAVGAAGEAFR